MADTRTDRTDYLGLLALMAAAADTQGWAYPYWNIVQMDAALNGLANAARTGAVPLSAPAAGPSLTLLESGGSVPAGQTIEIVQTFVDEWGRETEAGPVSTQATGDGLTDPVAAPTLGTPSSEAIGYGGGGLIVVFTWVDGLGGETLPSPAATVQLPYLAGGLYSQLDVTLPSTPAAAGAAQAWIYIQHRSGNVVLAKKITDPDQDTVTLDGTTVDCYLTPPYVNTTSATKSIEITGQTDAAAERTRFYVRRSGEEWTAGDHRLTVSGVDEWDIATVSYPLVYTGTNLTAGWPPTTSQVKAIRPIDLATETTGTVDVSQLPDALVLEQELARSVGEGLLNGCEVTAHAPADLGVIIGTGEVLLEAGRFVYAEDTDLVIPTADGTNPRIDIICIADDGAIEGPTENAALKGTAAAIPAAPEIPAGYMKLAEVAVAALETEIEAEHITDARPGFLVTLMEHETDSDLHFGGTEKADRLLSAADKTGLVGGDYTDLHKHAGGLGGRAMIQIGLHVEELQDIIESLRASKIHSLLREISAMTYLVDQYPTLATRMADTMFMELFKDGAQSINGVISGMEAETTTGTLDMPVSAGSCVCGGAVDTYEGGTVAIPSGQTGYKVWWDGSALGKGAAWPATEHTKLAEVDSDGSQVTAVDNTVRTAQSGLDIANEQFRCSEAETPGDTAVAGQTAQAATESNVAVMIPFQVSKPTVVSKVSFPHGALGGSGRAFQIGIVSANGGTIIAQTADKTSGTNITIPIAFTSEPLLQPGVTYMVGIAESVSVFSIAAIGYTTGAATLEGAMTYPTKEYKTKSSAGLTGSYNSVAGRYGEVRLWHDEFPCEVIWESTEHEVPAGKRIARILPTWYAVHESGVTDFEESIRASFDGGGTWEAMADGVELVPEAADPDSFKVRIEVTNRDTSGDYRLEDIGVIWELEDDPA